MKSILAALTVAALALAQGNLQIDTPPSIVQCQPAAIGFRGGQAPYFISILPGGQSTAAPLQQFPQQASAGSLTWTANIRAGTAITFQIRDGTGTLNYSDQVTILPGDSGCLGGDAGPVVSSNAPSSSTSPSSSSTSSSAGSSTTRSPLTTTGSAGSTSNAMGTPSGTSTVSSAISSNISSVSSAASSVASSAAPATTSGGNGAGFKTAGIAGAAVAGVVAVALALMA